MKIYDKVFGNNEGDEISISVKVGEYDFIEDVMNEVEELLDDNEEYYDDIEQIFEDEFLIRSFSEFTFNKKGVENLKRVIDLLKSILIGIEIKVSVSYDGEDWWQEDGREFKEKCIDYNDFIENVVF